MFPFRFASVYNTRRGSKEVHRKHHGRRASPWTVLRSSAGCAHVHPLAARQVRVPVEEVDGHETQREYDPRGAVNLGYGVEPRGPTFLLSPMAVSRRRFFAASSGDAATAATVGARPHGWVGATQARHGPRVGCGRRTTGRRHAVLRQGDHLQKSDPWIRRTAARSAPEETAHTARACLAGSGSGFTLWTIFMKLV